MIGTVMKTQNGNDQQEGKEKLISRLTSIAVVAVMLFVIVVVLPVQIEHRVYVTIGFDRIDDVSAETVRVPLIMALFRSSQQRTGVYTLSVQVASSGFDHALENIPSGEYVLLVSNVTEGTPYTINVQLIKNSLIIDTFTLHTTF